MSRWTSIEMEDKDMVDIYRRKGVSEMEMLRE